jgi:rhamnulokinase/L-fuculokinase
LLKNVMGLWLAQQCRAAWHAEGSDYDYDTLSQMAQVAPAFRSLVDPDDLAFLPPGDMPARIREFCRRSGQPEPETVGEVMRTVYESLALKYRYSLEKMMALANRSVERIHVVGGGSQSALLNQMTADACNRAVVAGPVEATALGNAIVQLIALGEFSSVAQARELLSHSGGLKDFTPRFTASWEEAYQRFQSLLTTVSI